MESIPATRYLTEVLIWGDRRKTCNICGKKFYASPYYVYKRKKKYFCCYSHMRLYDTGGKRWEKWMTTVSEARKRETECRKMLDELSVFLSFSPDESCPMYYESRKGMDTWSKNLQTVRKWLNEHEIIRK